MIYVSFSMTIRDGEQEYSTDYIASINANSLSSDLIKKTLMKEVCMQEIGDPEDCRVDENDVVWDDGGDYRCVWLGHPIILMPKAHFKIMKKYNICAFENLKAVSQNFQFR